jgi:hypothetical protein
MMCEPKVQIADSGTIVWTTEASRKTGAVGDGE